MIRALRFCLEVTAVVLIVLGLIWCANRAPYALAAGLIVVAVVVWVIPQTRRPQTGKKEK
jgi:hypothetical protein